MSSAAVGKVKADVTSDVTAAKAAYASASTTFKADFEQFLTDAEAAGHSVAAQIKALFVPTTPASK